MKKEMVMWLIVAVLVVGLLLGTQKAETMAINFDGTGDYIKFTTVAAWNNLTTMSVCFWTKPTSLPDISSPFDFVLAKRFGDGSNGGWNASQGDAYSVANTVLFGNNFATGYGRWTAPANSLEVGVVKSVCITYDRSSAANDPIIYIGGESVLVTEQSEPVGVVVDDAGADLYLGGFEYATTYTIDGIVYDSRLYNRIITPAEALQYHNARGRDNIRNGLVFCPFLMGAKGLQAFDGATLAAGNTIVDPCSGAVGVPAGNPVGVGETYLR